VRHDADVATVQAVVLLATGCAPASVRATRSRQKMPIGRHPLRAGSSRPSSRKLLDLWSGFAVPHLPRDLLRHLDEIGVQAFRA